jgi:hypothetical protein
MDEEIDCVDLDSLTAMAESFTQADMAERPAITCNVA